MPKITKQNDKIMDYDDAPSGYVTLYQYKEPFMPYTGGFGFRGALLFDGKTQKVQCHLCGRWEQYLPNHLHKEHNMTARAYKNEVGLRQSTALLSEALREKLVLNGVDKRIQNLIPGGKKTQEEKDKVRATLKKTTMEDKNRRGTCPAQLLDRLYKKFQKYGRMPTHKELGEGLADTIVATYGTMKEACRLAEVPYRKPGENVVDPVAEKKVIPSKAPIEYDRDMLLRLLRVFKDTHNREPYRSDLKRGLLPDRSVFDRYFESFKEAKEIAFRDYSI